MLILVVRTKIRIGCILVTVFNLSNNWNELLQVIKMSLVITTTTTTTTTTTCNLWMIWQYFPCLSCDLLSSLLIGSNSSSLFNEKGHVITLWNESCHDNFILKSTLLREWMTCFYCILVIFCMSIYFSLLSIFLFNLE